MNTTPTDYTIAFYNIENLFDIENNKFINDRDFLPTSKKQWTKKRYRNKVEKLGTVISKIGKENTQTPPVLVGLAEVENEKALSDLINSPELKDKNYSFIHYDSPDERGIDVALLYNTDLFEVTHSQPFSVYLERPNGEQDYTRDILLVKGTLDQAPISVLINHWSSRREGIKETEFKRIAAAKVVNTVIKTLKEEDPEVKIIVMGDFNDNPNCKSIHLMETESGLFNPFKTVWSYDRGSVNHNFQWQLFDQILFSTNFFDTSNAKLIFKNAQVFNSKFITQQHGKYKGQPFRTFVGQKYHGGYSDHFPVYIELQPS
ncbi:endonuclease/exonuclease/phosphatase family protein [Winogradskyella arenosi]|uniref:Endonuclease/exonuclease/phosphatase domain-containing protein n=1 Tax=Winogradskyella arenosi TaxID=533325 RepID=A0A368ZIU9_9FLAO|nr:endonuclease/exonuclease/phosphatase family protein [Winogradskyella arenosi]RCW93709.1 hypothetical protein DFQ08_101507 [Winogradskyella arenosi]